MNNKHDQNDSASAHSKKALRKRVAKILLPPPAQGRGGNHFPNVALTSHTGKVYRFYTDLIRDKLVLLHFMSLESQKQFPSLTHLSLVAQRLGEKLGKQVNMYSISIDAENDTPEKLAAYAREHSVPAGWHLLRPSGDGTKLITDRFARHLSNHHPHQNGANLRMVHYGNGGVGIWGAFAADSDPDMAVTRLGWVQSGHTSGNEIRRAGPAKLVAQKAGRSGSHNV